MIRRLIENPCCNNKPLEAGLEGMARSDDWLLYYER